MEYLPDMENFSNWLLQYGGFALFGLLALGIVALPIPEETLMVVAGALMYHEKLTIPSTLMGAYLGSMCGITLSYILGRTAGHYLTHRYGRFLGLTEKRLKKAHDWFEKYGRWSLVVGYFIPGIRHFTGLVAGTTDLEWEYFTVFAYTGALIWVSTFLSIGYFFNEYCLTLFHSWCNHVAF